MVWELHPKRLYLEVPNDRLYKEERTEPNPELLRRMYRLQHARPNVRQGLPVMLRRFRNPYSTTVCYFACHEGVRYA